MLMRTLGQERRFGAFLDADIEFHSILLRSSGNEMFAALVEMVTEVIAGRTPDRREPHRPVPEALDLHLAVATAVASGNAASAEKAMSAVLDEVHHTLSNQSIAGPR